MFSQSLKTVLSSEIFRIAIRCLLGFIIVVMLLGALTGIVGRSDALSDAKDEADQLVNRIVTAYDAGGLDAAIAIVSDFSDKPEEDEIFANLRSTADGTLIAGAKAPPTPAGQTKLFVPDGLDDDDAFQLSGTALGDVAVVTVGVSLEAFLTLKS